MKELSNDNPHCYKELLTEELNLFVRNFMMNEDNCDFYWCVVEFWLNLVLESKTLEMAHITFIKDRMN